MKTMRINVFKLATEKEKELQEKRRTERSPSITLQHMFGKERDNANDEVARL